MTPLTGTWPRRKREHSVYEEEEVSHGRPQSTGPQWPAEIEVGLTSVTLAGFETAT